MEVKNSILMTAFYLTIVTIIAIIPAIASEEVDSEVEESSLQNFFKDPSLIRRYADEEGKEIDLIAVPGRPPEERIIYEVTSDNELMQADEIINEVPAFDWCYGCAATSAAMMFGYYDRTDYPNMYDGPANGGLCPLDNSYWGQGECPLSATHMGYDGLTKRGHVDDYWKSYDSKGPDPWVVGNWEEHTHANCTADFMGTNQWMWGNYSYNIDGGTIFAFNPSGAPTYDFQAFEPSLRLGCHGIRLFVESRGYNVNHDGNNYQNYNQYIEEIKPGGFSFQDFQSEIDAGRPVLIHVEGHTMIGYGYNDASDLIYLHNTWDHNSHSMAWGENYGGRIHYGVTVIKLEPVPTPVHNLKTSENFSTIQAAIDDADTSNGDVIEVDSGTYSENIVVSKSLTLRSSSGDPTDTIIITSDPGEHLINITSGYVNISGFTLKGATDSAKSGIYVEYAGLCRIENNNITDNYYGIYLNDSNYNSLKYNSVAGNNDSGFYLNGGSTGNDIFFNNIYGNTGFSFVNDQSIDALATDNWWGTTVNNTINTSIYDHYDDTSLGKVVYDPKLTSPSSGAPVPELSTVISLLIGLLALLGYVIRLEKNRGYRGTSV